MTSRHSTRAPTLAVLAIVLPLLLLGAYVGGYFWLGQKAAAYKFENTRVRRAFPSKGCAMVYEPLAKMESWLTGREVHAVEVDPYGGASDLLGT